MKKLIGVLVLFIFFGLSYYIGKPFLNLYLSKDEVQLDFKGKSKSLKIKNDLPLSMLGDYLFKNELIVNKKIINDLVKFKNYSKDTLKAGKYLIKKKWSNNKLVNQFFLMRNQNIIDLYLPSTRNLNILAGAVANQTSIDSLELCKLFNNEELQQKLGFTNYTFPTFFLPNTFEVYSSINSEDFVDLLRNNYIRFWNRERVRKATNIGLSQSEVTILASIIQMEQQVILNEHPKIAGLYINRLKKGMKLQADPTVKFAINEPNLKRVLNRHLKYDSPYNTYLYKGLPPGPICIPEVTSIDAVLNYQKHDYIYMCAEPTYSGRHNFAITYKGHIENYQLYKTWLDKEGIK